MIERLLTIFGVQTVAFVVLVLNIRALNRGFYLATAATEVAYALMNFYMIQRIATAHTVGEAVAYTLGCTLGSLIAMWISRHWR